MTFSIEHVNDYPLIRFEIRFERKFPIRRPLIKQHGLADRQTHRVRVCVCVCISLCVCVCVCDGREMLCDAETGLR